MRRSPLINAWLLVLPLLPLAGCGEKRPERMPVSGRVLIDDQPLTYGFVQVLPKDARPATGKIGADGRFTLTTFEADDGCVPGNHAVVIVANETIDATSQRWHAPKKYSDAAQSGLTAEIAEGQPEITIKLTWDGGMPFIEKFPAE